MDMDITYRETTEWSDIWIESASVCAKPRALLVGDSITRSYYPIVRDQVVERYACSRLASSKCVADPGFFKELDLVLCDYSFSMIHFNNGLHGWDYDEKAYGSGLARALDLLVAHCGAARVIWGSSTPVWEKDGSGRLAAQTERVRERNRIAEGLAAIREITTNDLFSLTIGRPEFFSSDGIHFIEDGKVALGKCVADSIIRK